MTARAYSQGLASMGAVDVQTAKQIQGTRARTRVVMTNDVDACLSVEKPPELG